MDDDYQNQQKSEKSQQQLKQVRKCLIETLSECKGGVSLAQLPQHLKRKLNFEVNLSNLGYPKFKDLILSMNDVIQIELKGQNHPFAYLIQHDRREATEEMLQKESSEENTEEQFYDDERSQHWNRQEQ